MRFATAIIAGALTLGGCDRAERVEAPPVLPDARSADVVNGQALYVQRCLLCHQHDGGGVPNMQPALVGSAVVAGDKGPLIELVLRGIGGAEPAMPASGAFGVVMPGSADLSDEEIADLLTYIRQAFAGAGAIEASEVATVREGAG